MEENPTQIATQPLTGERRDYHKTMDNEMDEGDVICILHPASRPALRAVERIAKLTPQHVLQNRGLSRVVDNSEDQDCEAELAHDSLDQLQASRVSSSKSSGENVDEGASKDIALRLTSRLRNPCMGFQFGRGSSKADIMLCADAEYGDKISKSHFRIYFNAQGVLMFEDSSTNGTFVDKIKLCRGELGENSNTKRMINGGEIIEILLRGTEKGDMRFIVRIPRRDRDPNAFRHNLAKYLTWLKKEERQAEAMAQAAVVAGQRKTKIPVVCCSTTPFRPFRVLTTPVNPLRSIQRSNPGRCADQRRESLESQPGEQPIQPWDGVERRRPLQRRRIYWAWCFCQRVQAGDQARRRSIRRQAD